MVNKTELMEKMKKKGVNAEALAKSMGISTVTLYRKMSNCDRFTVKQVSAIKETLHLSNKDVISIFFAE